MDGVAGGNTIICNLRGDYSDNESIEISNSVIDFLIYVDDIFYDIMNDKNDFMNDSNDMMIDMNDLRNDKNDVIIDTNDMMIDMNDLVNDKKGVMIDMLDSMIVIEKMDSGASSSMTKDRCRIISTLSCEYSYV